MRYVLLCWILVITLACQSNQKNETTQQVESSTALTKTTVQYASHFTVKYQADYKHLTVFPKGKSKGEKIEYALIPHGGKAPQGFKPAYIIEIPIRSGVFLSHTQLACLQALGLADKIAGVNETAYLPDEQLLAQIKAGKIKDVGTGGALNEEVILAMHPDIVMLGGAGGEDKLKALSNAGIKLVVNIDWLENKPLGFTEWLKFMAVFFDKEAEATQLVEEIAKKYETIRSLAQKATQKPKVLLNLPYKGTWYVPGGDSYIAQLLRDAYAEYAWYHEKNTGSLPLDLEAVYPHAMQADFWLNLGICRTKAEVLTTDNRFKDFPVVKNNKLYNYTHKITDKGGNEYLMTAILNPHQTLADIVKILHPELLPNHELYYYQPITP